MHPAADMLGTCGGGAFLTPKILLQVNLTLAEQHDYHEPGALRGSLPFSLTHNRMHPDCSICTVILG